MFRSAALLVLSTLLIASCATTPSPSPGASAITPSASAAPAATVAPTPPPRPSPSPVLGASAWPFTFDTSRELAPAIAPDGTIYLVTGGEHAQLVALDPGGHVKPGWPIDEEPRATFGLPAVGLDRSVHVEECAGAKIGCRLRGFDASGRERSGWPVAIPVDFACSGDGGCQPSGLDIGPDGTVVVSHWRDGGGLQFLAVDPSGKVKPGWPVGATTAGRYWTDPQIGSDGTLFILDKPDGSKAPARIAAYGPDGRSRAGWPVSVPDAYDYVLSPNGTVVARSLVDDTGELCTKPRRTVFTAIGRDGRTLAGWPRGSTGFASSPAVDADGTVYYVSATSRVYAHDRAGEVKAGWPVTARGAANGCGGGERPHLAPDGSIFVVGDEVTALSRDGHALPGWPYRPSGDLVEPCLDSDCYARHGSPAFGPDGIVYLVQYETIGARIRAKIVALDRHGQPTPGWPYRLPFDAKTVPIAPPAVASDGRVVVHTMSSPFELLALDADGTLAR